MNSRVRIPWGMLIVLALIICCMTSRVLGHTAGEEMVALTQDPPVPCTTTTILPCIDEDGDGYGTGDGCLGVDADDTNTNLHECTLRIIPAAVSLVLSALQPVTPLLVIGNQRMSLPARSDVVWSTSGIDTVWVVPLNLRHSVFLLETIIMSRLLVSGQEYSLEINGVCNGTLRVR